MATIRETIERAIRERKSIEIVYIKYSGEASKRIVSDIRFCNDYDEYGYSNDHIRGYCHLRNEERTFKIDRIRSASIVESDTTSLNSTYRPAHTSSYSSSSRNYSSSSSNSSSEGCYIATMVYGDYDDENVKTLRRYRDGVMSKSFLGRSFIRFYYATSPHLVKILTGHVYINDFIRNLLNSIVAKIRKKYSY
jgi:hypothetical protein